MCSARKCYAPKLCDGEKLLRCLDLRGKPKIRGAKKFKISQHEMIDRPRAGTSFSDDVSVKSAGINANGASATPSAAPNPGCEMSLR